MRRPFVVVLSISSQHPSFSASSSSSGSGSGSAPDPTLSPHHPYPASSSYSSASFFLLPYSFLIVTYYLILLPSPPPHWLPPPAPPYRRLLNLNTESRIFDKPCRPFPRICWPQRRGHRKSFLTSKNQFSLSIYIYIYLFLYTQNITSPPPFISQWPARPFRNENFISPKSPFPKSLFLSILSPKYPLPPPPFYPKTIASPLFLITFQPSEYFLNDEFSSLLFLLSTALLCLVWSSCSNLICLIWSNQIRSNILTIFNPLTLIFYDFLYSDQSNPIQYARSLFPAILSPL